MLMLQETEEITDITEKFLQDTDSRYAHELMNVGTNVKRMVGEKTKLMKGQMNGLLSKENSGIVVEDGLITMQKELSKVCPGNHVRIKIISMIFGENNNASKKLMKTIIKYQSAEKTIDKIRKTLHKGQKGLLNDNIELQRLKEVLIEQNAFLEHNSNMLKQVVNRLQMKLDALTEKTPAIEIMINALLLKIQDFKIMQESISQFKISTEMIYTNNELLSQAVDRICNTTLQLVYTSLAIQASLENQKKVLKVVQATKTFASDLLLQNAESLKETVQQTNAIYSDPVLDMEKLKKAHNSLEETIRESIESAKNNKAKIVSVIQELDNLPEIKVLNYNDEG